MGRRLASIALASALLGGCALLPTPATPLRPTDGPINIGCDDASRDVLELTYLRAGGFLMRWGEQTIMTAPFYSNPSFLRTGLATIAPDEARIRANMPALHEHERVAAMLVGHAHYDHLMDAAWIVEHLLPSTIIYGSTTAKNLLASRPVKVVSVEAARSDAWSEHGWQPLDGTTIRILPLTSEHAPHLGPIKLYGGTQDTPRATLPSSAGGWVEGQTLAYVIDFRRADGSTALRLHYQDSASTPPLGFPPAPLKDIDVSLLCAASFDNVPNYPTLLLHTLAPRAVVLAHWEDFFSPPSDPPQIVRATDGVELARRLDATHLPWFTPNPGTVFHVCPR